ncbi:NAD-dependent protein deacylase [Sulfidibacter corallicola]|uniref:protein acetyllysine N-acetyltransferase n=1 Tax=Sulfidibacter corallicola TaxID=2818388 RepID=A0A8A4TUQ0_SULCO|nr:NAD-dependent protein deacylase [Sulfidibacter corallicola]QTD53679.1 NAD-dependent protein deacylase [Sulfidibacter corallicola]
MSSDQVFLDAIQQAAALLDVAKSVLVITGAGISADSDLPVYRGIGGLYNDNATEEGMPIEEALSGHMLHANPEITWGHISRIEKACRDATHNRGHQVVAAMERYVERVCVFTQNVDGFHRSAGSTNIIDIHGDVHDLFCTTCHYRERVHNYSHLDIPPKCDGCGGLIRPDVVLFGELLSTAKLKRLEEEAAKGFDAVMTIGTSSLFPYIMQPVLIAKALGVPTIEINPGVSEVSEVVDIKVTGRAADSLHRIAELLAWEK